MEFHFSKCAIIILNATYEWKSSEMGIANSHWKFEVNQWGSVATRLQKKRLRGKTTVAG